MTPALGVLLLFAGCGGSAPQNTVHIKMANTYSDQLAAMTPLYRNLGLWRAIRDAPERCKKVDAGAFQQEYKDMALWTAHCTDTGQWMVFIAPNGDVQVRACADAATLQLPACKPLPAAEAEPAAKAPAKKG
ncbi:MAG TPA: hypothetical protein VFW19_01160 [Allosphingosinicella sp.]|nr:hypothetical protein [Allosphingosinicella sp.]